MHGKWRSGLLGCGQASLGQRHPLSFGFGFGSGDCRCCWGSGPRDFSSDLSFDVAQLICHQPHILVDLGLVLSVQKGDSEQCDHSQDNESQAVEDGSHEGQDIEEKGQLERIHQVFYQEEMPQLCRCGDHLGGNLLGQTLCLLPSQGQVHVQVGPDGVKECGVTQFGGEIGGDSDWAK